jgi:hypothetical protein
LYPERYEGKVDLVEVLVEEDGDLEHWARDAESGDTHTSVPLQAEQGAQPFPAAQGRGELDEKVRYLGPDVPEAVSRSRWDDDFVPGSERSPLPSAFEAERSRDTLEPLQLAGVDMHRHESAGSHEQVACDTLARPLSEHNQLTGDRFFNCVHGRSA